MLTYTIRRLVLAVPTLLFISLVIFLLLELAPGDPMAQVPLTVPPEVKEKMREALGLGQPVHIRFTKWLHQFFVVEPMVLADSLFGTAFAEGNQRVISWQTRSPVMDIVIQRIPQTLWVVGVAYVVAVLIALPVGIYSAYRQYSVFDQAGTFITMVGFAIPPFFSGVLAIVIFSVQLGWFPSIYNTTHVVNDWDSFLVQMKQMILPVMVLALQITSQLSRFMRASMLDNLGEDYVRTARAKGLSERTMVGCLAPVPDTPRGAGGHDGLRADHAWGPRRPTGLLERPPIRAHGPRFHQAEGYAPCLRHALGYGCKGELGAPARYR